MKKSILLFFTLLALITHGQTKFTPTDQFSVEGKVEHAVIFTMTALDTFKTKSLPDVIITNHLGVVKNNLTKLKGILLKDILSGVVLQPKAQGYLASSILYLLRLMIIKSFFPGMSYSTQRQEIMYILLQKKAVKK